MLLLSNCNFFCHIFNNSLVIKQMCELLDLQRPFFKKKISLQQGIYVAKIQNKNEFRIKTYKFCHFMTTVAF